MISVPFLALVPLLSAVLFRLRGSTIITLSDQATRLLVWSLPMALVLWFVFGGPWWMILTYTLGWFVGLVIGVWGIWMPLDTIEDWVCLTGRGFLVTFFAGAQIWRFSPYAALVVACCGLLMAVVNKIAQWIPSTIPNLNQGREIGEALYGFIIGLAIVVAALL